MAAAPTAKTIERWRRLPTPVRRAVLSARHLVHPGRRPHPHVRAEVVDGIAVVTYDDGKVNAISARAARAFAGTLDAVEADPGVEALVVAGRPGQFSAGFDLDTLMAGGRGRDALVRDGWELMLRLLTFPRPVVTACTGNAVAAGAGLLLTGDVRLGAAGNFRIGFNEAAIGLPLPGVVLMLVADRIGDAVFDEATRGARIYSPDEAVDAGFLHRAVPPEDLLDAAVAEARVLAGNAIFLAAKEARVRPLAERMQAQLVRDRELLGQIGG